MRRSPQGTLPTRFRDSCEGWKTRASTQHTNGHYWSTAISSKRDVSISRSRVSGIHSAEPNCSFAHWIYLVTLEKFGSLSSNSLTATQIFSFNCVEPVSSPSVSNTIPNETPLIEEDRCKGGR
mmetsp:Transcript_32101/g.85653  ORF Transcript_32101/g.85653 Transcript_32101/m.85653 type:complete len:123 (-) Transcript_32101:280-648(-)